MMSKTKRLSSQEEAGNSDSVVIIKESVVDSSSVISLELAGQFSAHVFSIDNVAALINLTTSTFVKVFNQPICLIYEYHKTKQTLFLLNHIDSVETLPSVPFDDRLLTQKESFLLNTSPTINNALVEKVSV